jgi:hypothetical protein
LTAIADLRGVLQRPGQPVVTLQEMQEAIEHGDSASAPA